MTIVEKIFSPLIHLFFPHICAGCGDDVINPPNLLCLRCLDQLPHTGFGMLEENTVERIFWGRIQLKAAMSEFYFTKGNIVQTLIHELKYKGNKEMGLMLGNMIGDSLIHSDRFNDLDALIPLPLYSKREFKRGYNQSEILCRGIAMITNIPIISGNVIRKRSTETQTKKRRTKRWENIEGSFQIQYPEELQGKHLLLVDDVITTGATIEACARIMLEIPGVSLSVATLAYATV